MQTAQVESGTKTEKHDATLIDEYGDLVIEPRKGTLCYGATLRDPKKYEPKATAPEGKINPPRNPDSWKLQFLEELRKEHGMDLS